MTPSKEMAWPDSHTFTRTSLRKYRDEASTKADERFRSHKERNNQSPNSSKNLLLSGLEAFIAQNPWQQRAACLNSDPSMFVITPGLERDMNADRVRLAKAVCAGCVVRVDCLEYALESREKHGIWGGLEESERERLLKERKARL